MKAAVFLDRDGVLVEDIDLTADAERMRLIPGAADGMRALQRAGLHLVLVTNQTVVARGLATEKEVEGLHERLDSMLVAAGGPALDAAYFCPHHPEATLERYRAVCDCRKPRPGLLRRAASDHDLDLARSFLVGDRMTDIAAGAAAGCRTVLVESGRHEDPSIVTVEPLPDALRPDHVSPDLAAAAEWIVGETSE